MGVEAAFLGVGVDRIDYTKGILERFRGLERFFEKNPRYREKFTFVQIGAPSRTRLKSYSDLMGEVEREAERINDASGRANGGPSFSSSGTTVTGNRRLLSRGARLPGDFATRRHEPSVQRVRGLTG